MAGIATGRSMFPSISSTSYNINGARTSLSIGITKRMISSRPSSSAILGAPSLPSLRLCASSRPNPTTPTTDEQHSSASEGDLNYILKLGVGTLLGSALIKYGSILLPEITRPNIVQALLMISTPVVVALSPLLKESTKE